MSDTANVLRSDIELLAVRHLLRQADPRGLRLAGAIRAGLDLMLDGQHTGRYAWDQLNKSERLHADGAMDIAIQREFGLPDGVVNPYMISNVELRARFTIEFGNWTVHDATPGSALLLLWADDAIGKCGMGLLRITSGHPTPAGSHVSNDDIAWVHREVPLIPNVLAQLAPQTRSLIFSHAGGQERVNELFRVALGHRITKMVVATVAQQEDYLKRVRSNGGARSHLRAEGIIILGDSPRHRRVAETLEAAVPGRGEFVALKLARTSLTEEKSTIVIAGSMWRLWLPGDQVDLAPIV